MNENTIEKLHSLYLQCNQKVCTDTRKIIQGSIFFALKGNNFDGNHFAQQALNSGCAYAVVDNPAIAQQNKQCILVENVLHTLQKLAHYHRKQIDIPVIAITGSNGKTTTKELITAVLSKEYRTLSTPGNFNNHIGLPLTLLQLKEEHQIAVIEMGANHPGEIQALCEIAEPNYAIITSIGKEHLEGFGDIETVKKTNGELYNYVLQQHGKIFIHIDNPDLQDILSMHIKEILEHPSFIAYSDLSSNMERVIWNSNKPIILGRYIDSAEDIFVQFQWLINHSSIWENFSNNIGSGKRINADILNKKPIVHTHLLAYHNFINALSAVCIGHYFQVSEKDIDEAIENYIPDKNRMQWIETSKNKIILDAYNANPTSMLAALEFFKEKKIIQAMAAINENQYVHFYKDKDKVLILGDMFELGEHAEKEHLEILSWITKNFSDALVFLIGQEFSKAVKATDKKANIQTFSSTDDFIKFLKHQPITGKFILIKASRGMQLEKTLDYL